MHTVLLVAMALSAGPVVQTGHLATGDTEWLREDPAPGRDGGEMRVAMAPARRQPDAAGRSEEARTTRTDREERVFSSVLVCYADATLASAGQAIRKENALAAQSGAANLTRVSEEKARAESAQRLKRRALTRLHERRLAPLPCSQPEVAHLSACMRGMSSVSARDWCEDAAWHEFNQQRELYALADLD